MVITCGEKLIRFKVNDLQNHSNWKEVQLERSSIRAYSFSTSASFKHLGLPWRMPEWFVLKKKNGNIIMRLKLCEKGKWGTKRFFWRARFLIERIEKG